MNHKEYIKIIIDDDLNLHNDEKEYNKNIQNDNNYNPLFILKKTLYPGKIYQLHELILLCTCYEIDENFNPTIYFLTILDNNIKSEIRKKNINLTKLELMDNIHTIDIFKKLISNNKRNELQLMD